MISSATKLSIMTQQAMLLQEHGVRCYTGSGYGSIQHFLRNRRRNQKKFANERIRGKSTIGDSYGNLFDNKKGSVVLSSVTPMALQLSTSPPHNPRHIPYPKEIVEYLDNHVIGQDIAKRVLAVGVYQHYQRLLNNLEIQDRNMIREVIAASEGAPGKFTMKGGRPYYEEQEDYRSPKERLIDTLSVGMRKLKSDRTVEEMMLDKSNIILTGPSGSGKTHLTQKLAEILNVPIALCDCTTLTQAGYVGDDVETVIVRLLQNADGDVERAEQGIVFLDEMDKINSSVDPQHSTGNRDVSGRGVQQALLKLVEGHTIKVKNPLNPMQKVDVDTSNILFIASGAFNSLDKLVAKRLETKSLGFGASQNAFLLESLIGNDESVIAKQRDDLVKQADQGDLIEFGMIPELVGRFPVLVPFHSLDKHMLMRVLTEPSNNIILQAQQFFALDGITLKITPCAISAIANEAEKRRTGARALKSILERVLLKAKFELPGTNTKVVIFDGAAVEGRGPYRAVAKDSPKKDEKRVTEEVKSTEDVLVV